MLYLSLAARESNRFDFLVIWILNNVDILNLFHLFHYKQQAIKYCMSLNLGWDYLEILLLLLAFRIPVVVCVAIFCCCQHQFNILKSPIICQKCLFYVYFEILLLLLLAFGIPVIVCVAIFCSWLLPRPIQSKNHQFFVNNASFILILKYCCYCCWLLEYQYQ